MRLHSIRLSGIAVSVVATALLIGCASTPPQDSELDQAQAAYSSASNNPKIAQAAPKQLQRASAALDRSTALRRQGASQADVDHYAYLSLQQVAIAQQLADANAAQVYIRQAGTRRNRVLLEASRQQTEQAQQQTQDANAETQQAQRQAQDANAANQQAQTQAQDANAATQQAQIQSDTATAQEARTQQRDANLQQQLVRLDAKQTSRGMVLTLGNVLFGNNNAHFKSGDARNLNRLAKFMRDEPARNIKIEGYTDNTGRASYNLALSKRRADSVRSALVSDGINPRRILAEGFGMRYPVISNDTAAGRQQNRRVEIVISNANGDFAGAR